MESNFQKWSIILVILTALVLVAEFVTNKKINILAAGVALAVIIGIVFISPVVSFALLLPITLVVWFKFYHSVLSLWDKVKERGADFGKGA